MIHATEETKNSDFIPDHLVDSPVLSIVLCPIVKESPSTPFPLFHLEPTSSKARSCESFHKSTFQMMIMLSSSPLARSWPSGDHRTIFTARWCLKHKQNVVMCFKLFTFLLISIFRVLPLSAPLKSYRREIGHKNVPCQVTEAVELHLVLLLLLHAPDDDVGVGPCCG